MMSMADSGFVLLAMPKAGSTVLQRHFARHAEILFRRPPGMKHMSAATFEATMAPWLDRYGRARDSYETVCLVRHPVDRALSWWRYRSRDDLGRTANSTRDLTFAQFADQLISGEVPLGTAANFVSDAAGTPIVDRLYRYDHLAKATTWMSERLAIEPPVLQPANVSPDRAVDLDEDCWARLEEHYAADVAVYEAAL